MFDRSGLTTEHYTALLRGWSTRAVQSNVTFSAERTRYCPSAQAARDTLTNAQNSWNITDRGVDALCFARLKQLTLRPAPVSLGLPQVELTPDFHSDELAYTAATVDLDMVTVTAIPVNPAAMLEYSFNGTVQSDFTTNLISGENTIDIEVILDADGADPAS